MTGNRVSSWLVRAAAAGIGACVACGAMAAEFHGTVKTSGLPLPGVTVTATQGDRKVATTTDERGAFSFAELDDGIWTLAVETLGFAKSTREVGVAHGAPAAEFALKILTEAALLAALDPEAVPARIYAELLRAESKGRYFNQHIRNRFRYAKVDPASGDANYRSGLPKSTE